MIFGVIFLLMLFVLGKIILVWVVEVDNNENSLGFRVLNIWVLGFVKFRCVYVVYLLWCICLGNVDVYIEKVFIDDKYVYRGIVIVMMFVVFL